MILQTAQHTRPGAENFLVSLVTALKCAQGHDASLLVPTSDCAFAVSVGLAEQFAGSASCLVLTSNCCSMTSQEAAHICEHRFLWHGFQSFPVATSTWMQCVTRAAWYAEGDCASQSQQ